MENRTFRLRVVYGKTGRLAYLSHLELTHALERMVRRAGLPFAVSQGFSPHMKIAFGSALPVGIGGVEEIFDIVLSDYVAPKAALDALAGAAPECLMPTSCKYIENGAKAASVAFPFSVYEVQLAEPVEELTLPDVVEVVRKKKSKDLMVRDFVVGEPVVDGSRLVFQLQSKDSGNLRPDVLLAACEGLPDILSIIRTAQGESPLALDGLGGPDESLG